jgi:hypothetical protein
MNWAKQFYDTFNNTEELLQKIVIVIKDNLFNFHHCVVYCKNFTTDSVKKALLLGLAELKNYNIEIHEYNKHLTILPKIMIVPF